MKENAFDLTVNALRAQGLNSEEILRELGCIFQKLTDSVADTPKATETKIRELLKEIGMPSHLDGYEYWVVAIQIYKKKVGKVSMTKDIYPNVAKICKDTTSRRVERSMRSAVEKALNRCPGDIVVEFFGNSISPKSCMVPNKEFIATIAKKV